MENLHFWEVISSAALRNSLTDEFNSTLQTAEQVCCSSTKTNKWLHVRIFFSLVNLSGSSTDCLSSLHKTSVVPLSSPVTESEAFRGHSTLAHLPDLTDWNQKPEI